MIDWHCHLLPGIDDGPASFPEALELASALHVAGFRTVHCTPHYIRGVHAADNQRVLQVLREMQERLLQQGIPLVLLPGREYYLDEFFSEVLADPLLLGESRYLLVEIPPHADPQFVRDSLFRAVTAGFTPLIAHPERCRLLDPTPDGKARAGLLGVFRRAGGYPAGEDGTGLLGYLRAMGCKFQGNLGSFAGIYGEGIRTVAVAHLAAGLYTCFGSDAHGPAGLQRWLERGLRSASAVASEGLSILKPRF